MTRKITVIALALALCLAGATRPAEAAPILDQQFTAANANFFAIIHTLSRAQTFTVGLAGRLSAVDILLDAGYGLTAFDRQFQIIPTNAAGLPVYGTPPLASFTITVPGNPGGGALGFYGADLTSFNLMVNPGDVLAIVDAGGDAPDNGHWWVGRFTAPPTYGGGAFYTTLYENGVPGTTFIGLDEPGLAHDLGFRTWVDDGAPEPPPVPEPATLILFGVGLAGIRLARKR